MSRRIFFIIAFILGMMSTSAASLPEELSGNISDAETGEPISGVIVQASNSAGKAIAFASSNATGFFSIKVNPEIDSISFRRIGYEAIKLPVSYVFNNGVRMATKATQLNDVIVQAPDIYAKGDTLVFNVARYANAKDNAIIDVIKRLPGIKVEDDGTIKYQGKPINKFYIDGNDFIGGQYGLATENISHEDVKSVEVMENHQPVKALEGIEFPEEAGINLKLKDDARSRWVGVTNTAAGTEPFLYDASLYAMRIASKVQNIVTLRGGNTGWNPASQITEHDFNDMFSADYVENLFPEYISADIIASPLTEKRTRDNRSWIGNTISAWKRGDNSMRFKLNYSGDRLDYKSSLMTGYFNPEIPDFLQQNSLRTQRHDLSAQFNSEINRHGYFLKDKFTANAGWNNSNSVITGSMNLDQNVKRHRISLTNDLKLVKRNDKKLFELVSRNSFVHSPNRLSISGKDDVIQNLGTTDFRSTTESQYGKLTRFWKFYLNGGIDLNYHRMHTKLSGMGNYDNHGTDNAFLANIYAAPQVDYHRNNWHASIKSALRWIHQTIGSSRDYLNIMPRLSVRKKTSAKSEFSSTLAYSLNPPQAYLSVSTPVLADYRNLFIGKSNGKYSHDFSIGFSYNYRNPLTAVFLNASAAYNFRHSSLMSNQLFIDDIIISTFADRISDNDTWHFHGGVSKGLAHSKMVVGCDFNASISSAASMRDSALNRYEQFIADFKPYFRGSILRWLSLNYEANYRLSELKIAGICNVHHSFNQNLHATVIPDDNLQFTVGAEHLLTRFPEGNTDNIILVDASAVWKFNGKMRLSLSAQNLLDKRRYEYMTYGTLSYSEHKFRLHPRNILLALQIRF